MNNFLSMLMSLTSNPYQFLASRGLNVPQNIPNDPGVLIQHLLNTGQVTQEQVNQANAMRNNPMIQRMFNGQ